jgi:cytoskeletal protein CcmA (bactofilin family)
MMIERNDMETTRSDFTLSALFIEDEETIEKSPAVPAPAAPATTVIGTDTVIEGDVHAAGHLEIFGAVHGDVTATGNILVAGSVEGAVTGRSISLSGCAVRGNVTADGELTVNAGSIIAGDLSAQSAVVNGKVRGSVTAKDAVVLHRDALLLGGVTGALITMQEGTALFGEVRVVSREEDEALVKNFDEAFADRQPR